MPHISGAGGQFQLRAVPASPEWAGGQVPGRGEATVRVSLPGERGPPRGQYPILISSVSPFLEHTCLATRY